MNEEEKKAIELLKIDCLVTSQQIKDGELFMIEDGEKMRISATQVLLNLIEKQQKEIKELKHFKEEVIEIIKYADDTAEPTYWNIRKLLGLGDGD